MSWRGRGRASAWLGGGLLALLAPRCAPQEVYLFDRDEQAVSAPADAGAEPDDVTPAVPVASEPDEPAPGAGPPQPPCESDACQACVDAAACAGSALPLCHPQSGACVAPCEERDAGAAVACPDGTLCDTAHGVCVQCLTRGDCAAPTPACEVTSGRCVDCVDGSDCGAAAPVCDTSVFECAPCTLDSQCAVTEQVCQESTGRCVECELDADCVERGDDDDDRFCSPSLRCVECLVDAHCAASEPDKPFCTSELECEDERE